MIRGTVVAIALGFSTPAPPIPIPAAQVVHASCPDGGGSCYYQGNIYAAPGATAFTLWHERGHAFDHEFLTDSARIDLQRLMRAPTGEWRRPYGASEWFADYYAACHLGVNWRHGAWQASYVDQPSRRRFRAVCNGITAVVR